ncbi:fimbrial protein, partial [Salmonella enterica]|nr:fimbrial protein [Salmonella enterica]
MRNKIILAMAAAGMMCATSAFAAADPSGGSQSAATPAGPFGTGQVTFTGVILNSPCDIQSGDEDMTVKFGQISHNHLKGANTADTQDVKAVTIHLLNCSFDQKEDGTLANSKVSVKFSGDASGTEADTHDVAYVNPTGPGMASGVGVQLLDSSMKPLIPSTLASTGTADQQLKTGTNQIQLFAQLINLGAADSVVPGNINIPLTYTLTY